MGVKVRPKPRPVVVPPALRKALAANPKAKAFFDSLPPSHRREFADYVAEAKRPETVERRLKRTVGELESMLDNVGIDMFFYGKDMLKRRDFVTSKRVETVTLIRLALADLGFKGKASIQEIYKRAQELGLDLCRAEDGVYYRLAYQNQPKDERVFVGMPSIAKRGDSPCIFELERASIGTLMLKGEYTYTRESGDLKFGLYDEFVFRLNPLSEKDQHQSPQKASIWERLFSGRR
jgi:hypothetical protein